MRPDASHDALPSTGRRPTRAPVLVAATLLLAACVPATPPLWPTLTGDPVAGEASAGAGGWPAP
ncbi:MAG: hypothetical protein HKM95_11615, partial [Inquilinus sp.]|nr:hypothetical protein [Inquilinus sp.]